MKTYPWLKLYVELLDDVKLERLSDSEFRFWIYLLCMARESTTPGVVTMDEDGMAWRIRRPLEFVCKGLRACIGVGLVVAEAEGFVLPKFTARNADRKPESPAQVAARAKAYRERKALEAAAALKSASRSPSRRITQRGHANVTQAVTAPRSIRDDIATERRTAGFEDVVDRGFEVEPGPDDLRSFSLREPK